MSEAAFVNVFTVIRVLIIGGFLLVLPVLSRKGLLFGAYIGEERSDGEAARALRRVWSLRCLALMGSALVVGLGISAAGAPLAGNLTATAVLLVVGLVLYLRAHYTARALAAPQSARQAQLATAPLELAEPKGANFAKVALAICLIAGIATVMHAMVGYTEMPDRVPTHFGPGGEADSWRERSVTAVMVLPTLNLVLCPFLALLALLTARAKRSVRAGGGGRSLEAQLGFRAASANLITVTALFTCAFLTYSSVQLVRFWLSQATSIGAGFFLITTSMILFMIISLIWMMSKYGQGGARLEEGSAEAPLTNGIADNANWVAGMFYVNRDDPSIMVEKRFGFGYTVNFGNRKAAALFVSVGVLTTALVVLGLVELLA